MLKKICLALVLLLLPLALFAQTQFVILIVAHNLEPYCQGNLASLITQNYSHWKAIYINDGSTDQTKKRVDEFIEYNDPEQRIQVIHTKKRLGVMHHLYHTIRKESENKVIVLLDGDDRLAHSNVLEHLAQIYESRNVWLTYGSCQSEAGTFGPINEAIPKEIRKKNAFRKHNFTLSPLITFYAKLFQKIEKNDLMIDGEFVPVASTLALMLPMLEMASKRKHTYFVKEILCIYNHLNPFKEDKIAQEEVEAVTKKLKAKKPYKPLKIL